MTVEHFDAWYAAMSSESPRDRLWQQFLGLPPEFVSSSLLSLDGIREIAGLLRLEPQHTLLDLACGRGGYGMWAAREAGCRVVGIDFSAVAIDDATRRIPDFGLDGRADYRLGSLEEPGLPASSVDAALCVDAIQFASDTTDACREILRVLRPGGRVAITCWHAVDRNDGRLPKRLRTLDLQAALTDAGFADVSVEDRADWLDVERRLWEAVLALDPGDDQALADAREEGERLSAMGLPDASVRVLATGRAPG